MMVQILAKNNLILHRDSEMLTNSWLAGTNSKDLQKLFKYSDINIINVQKVCERISSVIQKIYKTNYFDFESSCSVRFRTVSYLYFGTIRIFHHQVQRLFDQTRNFVVRTAFKITGLKRQSEISYNHKKCRRVEKSEGFFLEDFGGLIYELATDTKSTENNEKALSTVINNCNLNLNVSKLSHTIIEEVNVDQALSELNETDFSVGTLTERPEILCHALEWQDSNFNDDDLIDERTSPALIKKNGILSTAGFSDSNLDESSTAAIAHKVLSNCNVEGCLAPEVSYSSKLGSALYNTNDGAGNTRKLIIDKFIKLTDDELKLEWDQYKRKHCFSAPNIKTVVKNLTKKSGKLSFKHKYGSSVQFDSSRKRKRSHFSEANEYVNVLNEILGHTTDNILGGEKMKIKETFQSVRESSSLHVQNFYENNGNCIMDDANELNSIQNNRRKRTRLTVSNKTCTTINSQAKHILIESRSVFMNLTMVRLAHALQNSRSEFIDAREFIHSAICRKDAALTFYTLLELAKKKHIIMKKSETTSQIEKIYPGPLPEIFEH